MDKWTWATQGNGLFLTLTAPEGESLFFQGDEAVELYKQLDNAPTEDIQQAICREYAILSVVWQSR